MGFSDIAKAPVSHGVEPHDLETGPGLRVGPRLSSSRATSRRPYRASGLVQGSIPAVWWPTQPGAKCQTPSTRQGLRRESWWTAGRAAVGGARLCYKSPHDPPPDKTLRRRGLARRLASVDGGADGRGEAHRRAAPPRPRHAHDAEAGGSSSRRRLALLGDQGPDRRKAKNRRRRAVHGFRRDRPLQAVAGRRSRRCRPAADARVPGLALLRAEIRSARPRRDPARLCGDAGGAATGAGGTRVALAAIQGPGSRRRVMDPSAEALLERVRRFAMPEGDVEPRDIRFSQQGEMQLAPDAPWRPFRAEQWMSRSSIDFRWRARVRMARFAPALVVD